MLLAMLTLPVAVSLSAQSQEGSDRNIIVNGEPVVDLASLTEGPEVKGVIAARNGDRIRAGGGLFGGRGNLGASSLLNGLPVTVKTLQGGGTLVARQITFRNNDLKTANMIRNGTAQQFAEQTAATEALRGRMSDIDQYNIKSTTNVYFDTGKTVLSPQARAELCQTATTAEGTNNALMLVVGYTDSVGSEDFNQELSERRAARVINYLQQACRWKPYRMLTPTGMAEADPLASNDTPYGKAQNRRVSVNVLVSKGLDGL